MLKLLEKVKNLLWRARGAFNVKIPRTDKALEAFTVRLLTTYGYPDLESYRFAIANAIMHTKPDQVTINPRWIARCIANAQAKQEAFAVQDAQRKRKTEMQKAAHEAAKKAILEADQKSGQQAGRIVVDHSEEEAAAGQPDVGVRN